MSPKKVSDFRSGEVKASLDEIINLWCKEENRRTGATRWFIIFFGFVAILIGMAAAILISELLFSFKDDNLSRALPLMALIGLVATIAWLAFKPETVSLYIIRSSVYYYSKSIPDSLLEKIADSKDIPESIKAALADQLKTQGSVSFQMLFELQKAFENHRELIENESRVGFRKMMNYRHEK